MIAVPASKSREGKGGVVLLGPEGETDPAGLFPLLRGQGNIDSGINCSTESFRFSQLSLGASKYMRA